MSDNSLVAELGRLAGSRSSGRLRRDGKIPGVLYGHGMAPVALAVGHRELRHVLTGPAGLNAVLDLKVGSETHAAIVKDLQRDTVRRSVTHVDFQVVNLNEEITVEVPIVLHGESKAVLSGGGLVDPQINTLTVVTTPRSIPNEIVIDISNMQMGDTIRVGDIALPAGVTTPIDAEVTVVAILLPSIEAEPEPEAAEGDAAAEGTDSASE